MKKKTIVKRILDVLMTIGLLFSMGYQFWGDPAHEWVGAGTLVLFIIHHFLNINWYKSLLKGRYTPMRIVQLFVNVLTFMSMLALMYSGIVLSTEVFAFLSIESGLALARRLHILGLYWGFILMSIHLGLHWNMVLGMFRKKASKESASKVRSVIGTVIGLMIAGYGISVFIRRDFLTYLLLKSEFVFLDYDEPVLLFYIDYLALMGMCIFIAHTVSKVCRRVHGRKEKLK